MDVGPLLSHLIGGGWKVEIEPAPPLVRAIARRHEVKSSEDRHDGDRTDWTVMRERQTADLAIQSVWKAIAGPRPKEQRS